MSIVNVHNNWDPLKEIWLGDVYPAHFYDDLPSNIRDSFYKLTEHTKNDLNVIQRKLEEFGITVKRPNIEQDKSKYIIEHKDGAYLVKPPICPRDSNAVIGNKLYTHELSHESSFNFVNHYGIENVVTNYLSPEDTFWHHNKPIMNGASIVKLGKDIIFDKVIVPFPNYKNSSREKQIEYHFQGFKLFKEICHDIIDDYRWHYSTKGGHADGCFMPVKPGLVLITNYWDNSDYDTLMPGWEKINISEPTWVNVKKMKRVMWENNIRTKNNKIPTLNNDADYSLFSNKGLKIEGLKVMGSTDWTSFNKELSPIFKQYIKKFQDSWTGNFKETFFEVNNIMIDENNMLCLESIEAYDPLFKELERNGVKIHMVPFKTRSFWDGGLHCVSLDTHRVGSCKDYFPNRGDYGVKTVDTKFFNSTTDFLREFEVWNNNLINLNKY